MNKREINKAMKELIEVLEEEKEISKEFVEFMKNLNYLVNKPITYDEGFYITNKLIDLNNKIEQIKENNEKEYYLTITSKKRKRYNFKYEEDEEEE